MSGPYELRDGEVWYVPPGRAGALPGLSSGTRVCSVSGELAVAYDEREGVLHKHGESGRVRDWADAAQARFREAGFAGLAEALVVVAFRPLPEAVDELNACIATSGRISGFVSRLAAAPSP